MTYLLLLLAGCGQSTFTANDKVTVITPRKGTCESQAYRNGARQGPSELFDLDLRPFEYYHYISCDDPGGRIVFATVMLSGVPFGTDPGTRMSEDFPGRTNVSVDGPSSITSATLSGLPAVQIEGDLAWMLPVHRVTRAVVIEDVLFAAGVWGTREEMTARADEATAWLDAVRFHDFDAYRTDR